MSRIGNKPVAIPSGVTVTVQGSLFSAKGPQGQLDYNLPSMIRAELANGQVVLSCSETDKESMALHGTTRSLISNLVQGVHKGYTKDLQILGVGFRAALQGKKLVLSLGYSHPIEFHVPEGITVKVADNVNMSVSGPDKHLVGLVSAQIRSFYPPEPYKGKGIRYKNEYVRHKAGKTVA